jgi:hypothetical protein
MKPGLLIALGVVALATVGGAAYIVTKQNAATQEAQLGQRLYPELAARAGDIQAIVIARKEGSFRIVRDGDRWLVPDKSKYPASPEAVRKLLVGLSELRAMEAKTRQDSIYPELEVENIDAPNAKSVQVSLQDGSGQNVLAVLIGKNRFGRGGTAGDGVYIRKVGDAQAWLAQGRVSVDREVSAWLDRRIADVARDRVQAVTVKNDKQVLTVQRAKADDKDFGIKNIPADRKAKSSYDTNAVGGAFETLDLDDVRPAAEVNFSASSPTTEAVTFDGLRLSASFAEKDGGTWVRFAAKAEPPAEPVKTEGDSKLKSADDVKKEAEAINAKVGGWAYKLPAYKVESMRRKMDDLLEQKAS